jgi:hypothetical protein
MNTRKAFVSGAILLFAIITAPTPGLSVSSAVKSHSDYVFTLNHIRDMRVIVDNFGDEAQKKEFDEIKTIFNSASEDFYAQNFVSSYQKYFNLKERLWVFMENIAAMYIKRSQDILDSTSKASFDILINYGKGGPMTKFFRKPFNPLEDIKPYKEEEYHFFHSRETIERYLRGGYKNLQDARNLVADPDLEVIKKKKNKTSANLDFMIHRYSVAVDNCRLAKQYGIEIHKMIKVHQVGDIQRKYNLPGATLEPVFDDRIPEEFKVDANDNIKLIHSIEKERLSKKQQAVGK